MTILDPNGCPEHRGSHCEADQAPPKVTHRIPGLNEQGHDAIEHHNP
jgi:hypothetical protein